MTERTENIDIEVAALKLSKYWATYDEQYKYTSYSDQTFIHDALYGLGIAIDPKEYKCAQGYDKFKAFLLDFLQQDDALQRQTQE